MLALDKSDRFPLLEQATPEERAAALRLAEILLDAVEAISRREEEEG